MSASTDWRMDSSDSYLWTQMVKVRSCLDTQRRLVQYHINVTEQDSLHSEVIGGQSGVVNLEDIAGVVQGGIKHLLPERLLATAEQLTAHIIKSSMQRMMCTL